MNDHSLKVGSTDIRLTVLKAYLSNIGVLTPQVFMSSLEYKMQCSWGSILIVLYKGYNMK